MSEEEHAYEAYEERGELEFQGSTDALGNDYETLADLVVKCYEDLKGRRDRGEHVPLRWRRYTSNGLGAVLGTELALYNDFHDSVVYDVDTAMFVARNKYGDELDAWCADSDFTAWVAEDVRLENVREA